MSGRTKKRMLKIGGSRVITLPPEWAEKQKSDTVHLIFNDYLLIIPGEQEELIEQIFGRVIRELVEKEKSTKPVIKEVQAHE
jgi:hypothetical protein